MKEKELKWILEVLDSTSKRSTCSFYQVGAIIVKDGRIVSTGWNGTPPGVLECREYQIFIDFSEELYTLLDADENKENVRNFLDEFYNVYKRNKSKIIDFINSISSSDKEFIQLKNKVTEILSKYKNDDKVFSHFEYVLYSTFEIYPLQRVENKFHSRYEIHAEMNAISFAARNGISLEGAELVCNYLPCLECSKIIVQSGIKKVYYLKDYIDKRFNESSENFLKMSGVEIVKVD